MIGRFLKKHGWHGWHRKPVTHAATLWALVAFAAFLLLVFLSYSKELTAVKTGVLDAKPAKTQMRESLPTVFGTVVSFDGQVIGVESKQGFSQILVDDVTNVTDLKGNAYILTDLKEGATVVATGNTVELETLLADALVILSESTADTK